MHPNPIFRSTPADESISFARERSFGTLIVSDELTPLLAHVPFILNGKANQIDFHLLRSNPIARMVQNGVPAVLSVTGPDSYISPDWYNAPDQVPTWNYVAVHFRGVISCLPDGDLPLVLDRLSEQFEARLAPKPMWSSEKVDPVKLAKMMRMVVPLRMTVSEIDSTWKLSQNKSQDARLSAAIAVEQHGIGTEMSALASMMRDKTNS